MGLMKKLTSVVVTAGLLLGLVGTAAAAYPDGVAAAAGRMHDLGLVNGKVQGSSDLQLNDPITRAELVTIIVRAFGKANDAKFLKGAAAFPDTASHWASGEIALAKNMIEANGFSMGMPDGTFAPDAKLTTAQAVAFVMKFLGAPRDASQAWPNDYLNGAVAAGLMSADDKAALEAVANNDANRGLAFYLADEAFYSYKMADGKTVYTEFVKPTAPTVTLDEVAPTTKATATVSGSVSSDATAVYVGSMANQVTVTAGKFSADVDLTMGDNNISVMATDLAGNTTTKTLTITRTVGAAASIDAPATLTVKAGDTVDLAAAVKDADGNTISDAVLTATGDAGTLADGKFTAATKAGSYTLTLTSGDLTASVAVTVTAADLASVAITPATVNLAAGAVQKFAAAGVDQYGNTADLSGVTWSASAGVIDQSGNFAGTGAGNITITATAGAVSGTATATVFGAATALKVSVAGNLSANNSSSTTTATITAVDANGNPVPNANNVVDLTSSNSLVFTVSPAETALVNGVATVTLTSAATTGATAFLSATSAGLTGGSVLVTAQAQTIGSITLSADPAALGVGNSNHGRIKASLLDTNGQSMKAPVAITVQLTSGTPTVASFVGDNTVTIGVGSKYAYTGNTVFTAGNVPGSTTVSGAVTSTGYTNLSVSSVTVSTSAISTAYKLSMDPISAVTVDNGSTYVTSAKVRVLDYNGNQVTSYNSDPSNPNDGMKITFVDPTGDAELSTASGMTGSKSYTNYAEVVNGAATMYLTDIYAETLDIQAFGTNLGSVTGQATFNAGVATKLVAYAPAPSTIANDGGVSQTVLKFKVADAFSNVISNSSASITLVKNAGNGATSVDALTMNASGGYASFTVKSTGNTGYDEYYAKSAGLTNSATKRVTVANVGSPYQLGVYSVYDDNNGTQTSPAASNWTSGNSYTVKVGVYDQAGALVSSDNGRTVNLTVTVGTATIEAPSATTTNGIASFTIDAQKSGTVQLTATTTGLAANTVQSTTFGSITVAAGWPTQLILSASPTTLANDNSSNVPVTVYSADAYGNYSNPKSAATATLTLDSVTAGGFSTGAGSTRNSTTTAALTTGSSSASSALNFYSTGVIGSGTITATAPGYQSATLTMSTSNVGAPVRLAVGTVSDKAVNTLVDSSTPADQVADSSTNDWLKDSNQRSIYVQKVTVSVVDNAGLQVTGGAAGNVAITFAPSADVWMYYSSANPLTWVDYSSSTAGTYGYWKLVGPDETLKSVTVNTTTTGARDFYVISPVSGAITYTASAAGTAYTGVTASGNFATGVATKLKAEATPTTIAANGTSQSLIKVSVTDDNGNVVTSWNGTASVSVAGPADLQSSTVNIASGVGSVYITSRAQVGKATVTPSVAGIDSKNVTAADVQIGSPATITGTVGDGTTLFTVYGSAQAPVLTTKNGPFSLPVGYQFTATLGGKTVTSTAVAGTQGTAAGAAVDVTKIKLSGGSRLVTVTLNGTDYTLTLPALDYSAAAKASDKAADLQSALNNAATLIGINNKVTFAVTAVDAVAPATGGTLAITATDSVKGTDSKVNLVGDAVLGLDAGNVTPANGTGSVKDITSISATELAGLITGGAGYDATVMSATVVGSGVQITTVKAADTGSLAKVQIAAAGGSDLTQVFSSTSASGADQNDALWLTFNGTTYKVNIASKGNLVGQTAAQMASAISTAFTNATPSAPFTATVSNGKISIQASLAGGYSMTLADPGATSCYSVFGFTANTTVWGN